MDEIMLKNNIKFVIFNDKKQFKQTILNFIYDSKSDKILYKGNPSEINYKLLKKILPMDNSKIDSTKSIKNIVKINDNSNVRDVYSDLLNKVKCEYCLIHKI